MGYGVIVAARFFEQINRDTAKFAAPLLPALADEKRLLAVMTILSMSNVRFSEMKEKLQCAENELQTALGELVLQGIVVAKKSKHKFFGTAYEINNMYHTCLCVLIATIKMEDVSLKGIS